MSEIRDALSILKSDLDPEIAADEEFITMPDPKVKGCVLIGLKKAQRAVLVFTEEHFDEWSRGEYEEVDWEQAKVYLERWEAGLDGEALISLSDFERS